MNKFEQESKDLINAVYVFLTALKEAKKDGKITFFEKLSTAKKTLEAAKEIDFDALVKNAHSVTPEQIINIAEYISKKFDFRGEKECIDAVNSIINLVKVFK